MKTEDRQQESQVDILGENFLIEKNHGSEGDLTRIQKYAELAVDLKK